MKEEIETKATMIGYSIRLNKKYQQEIGRMGHILKDYKNVLELWKDTSFQVRGTQ